MKKILIPSLLSSLALVGCGEETPETTAENTAPVFKTDELSLAVSYRKGSTIDVAATDKEGDTLTYSIVTKPRFGQASIDSQSGVLTYLPSDGAEKDAVEISVTDGKSTSYLSVELTLTNAEPQFDVSTIKYQTHYKKEQEIALAVSDPDNDPLTIEITSQPESGTAEITEDNRLIYTPEAPVGEQKIDLTVSDGVNSNTLSIYIDTYNRSPVISVPFSRLDTSYKRNVTVPLSMSDPDGDELTVSVAEQPKNGYAEIKAGQLIYTPDGEATGEQIIRLEVSDGFASNVTDIILNLVNSSPEVSVTPQLTVDTDGTATGRVLATDADGDSLSYRLLSSSDDGNLIIDENTGDFTYRPTAFSVGKQRFVIGVSDGKVTTQTEVVISVTTETLTLESSSYSSDSQRVEGQLLFTGPSGVVFTTEVNNDKDIESLAIDDNGRFTLVAKPYAEPIDMVVTASFGNESVTAVMKVLTQQKNQASDDSDPLYFQQWHLHNTGQTGFSHSSGTKGFDINIGQLHKQGLTGNGVEVAVVDTGLELAHEDLRNNVVPGASYDFVNKDTDPSPEYKDDEDGGDHGTSVAGLIAAEGFNQLGGRGVAPEAGLTGFNYLEHQTLEAWKSTHGGDKTRSARVINQSYGYGIPIVLPTNAFDFKVEEAIMEEHYRNSDNPALMIKSAGNGFNGVSRGWWTYERVNASPEEARLPHQLSNSDPSNASFYNTLVSALSADANAPRSSYSTTGSSVMFSAPGGEYGWSSPAMVTTDVSGCEKGYSKEREADWGRYFTGGLDDRFQELTQCSYTSEFNGTSSAAPVASGVAALVMEANPAMSWRDVRYVMAKTATKIDVNFQPVKLNQAGDTFVADPGWITNAAGNHFHNWYGFGMVNATKAVQMAARDYALLPPLQQTTFIPASDQSKTTIPENFQGITKTFEVPQNWTVEGVQVKVDIEHSRMNDLSIELISPSGTRSIVATARNMHMMTPDEVFIEPGPLLFLSQAFLDEKAGGTWQLRVIDTNSQMMHYKKTFFGIGDPIELPNNQTLGKLNKAELRIYGHEETQS
ncbi:S8 family serine peptidase [Veronia pacifica]|uniref:P/Homo B domain-containing protein n=1 Tax=Veronia pacifica TaxID=1080227 RepID=A0A1C3ELD4_9GAMM|nr:S8 family serine peptidase [Veronia pacifica]ODA34046.1 hypothetical protein A8L45_08355 [Veronia pacifica]